MVKILGIDPSLTATGIAIVSKSGDKPPLWHDMHIITTKDRGHPRMDYIQTEIWRTLSALKNGDIIAMEGPSFGSKGGKSHELAGGWWMVKHAIYTWLKDEGVELKGVYIIPPRSRAKYATGNGNAKKEAVMESVQLQTKINVTDHNIADAMVLATMGARLGGAAVDVIPPEEMHRVTPLVSVKNQLENGLQSF